MIVIEELIVPFFSQREKEDIIRSKIGYVLVEERYLKDGNYLIFISSEDYGQPEPEHPENEDKYTLEERVSHNTDYLLNIDFRVLMLEFGIF